MVENVDGAGDVAAEWGHRWRGRGAFGVVHYYVDFFADGLVEAFEAGLEGAAWVGVGHGWVGWFVWFVCRLQRWVECLWIDCGYTLVKKGVLDNTIPLFDRSRGGEHIAKTYMEERHDKRPINNA